MSIDLGLQRISRLLARTPLTWRAIHVAGTNGKGSTTAYASTMLDVYNRSKHRREHGKPLLKHARFNSPHLIDPWDCISINNQVIPQELYHHIHRLVRERNESQKIHATNFELLTATAFEIFTHEEIDIGVVEVGMGGRLDATNIIGQVAHETPPGEMVAERSPPLVTAVTRIGLDHQAFLGDRLEEIAREKAGILKPGVPVVYDMSNPPNVMTVLDRQADILGCNVLKPKDFSEDLGRTIITICSDRSPNPAAHIYGSNLSVAYRAVCEALRQLRRMETDRRKLGYAESYQLAQGMLLGAAKETVYPGRLQHIDLGPLVGKDGLEVLLDGAHNAQSAQMLSQHVWLLHHRRDSTGSRAPVSWVLAFSDTKDVQEMLKTLLQPGDRVFAVEFGPVADMPWVKAMDCRIMAEAVGKMSDMEDVRAQSFGDDVVAAIRAAGEDERPVVVAGSLYLVGDVLRNLRDARST
ncbi:dihydrofolate synthetase-like protein [Teratosphaeria destructans]|uniref:Dihydrofolate synthetase-like protein n=1 Tax=Teratosphaeria destructans TaxID=418781 RepID=A0A9W7SXT9_9PEZI|nr:dihydrofolate synthetase-like protein [Teratosphaeria destructans]